MMTTIFDSQDDAGCSDKTTAVASNAATMGGSDPSERKNSVVEQFLGNPDFSSGLPNGWKVNNFETKQSKIWYTDTNKKLLSKIEVQMFLNLLDLRDGNEERAWHLFLWFRRQPDLWQKAKIFCEVQLVQFTEYDSDKFQIVDEDYDFITKYLIQIKSIG